MKSVVSDLASYGGAPAFPEKLHVGRPNIGDRDVLMNRIGDMLDNRWLSNNGPYVKEFEQKIADYLGVKHCIAMCNATIALEIVARAAGVTGEVIVPSFTFVATAHALQWQEITPIFADIDPKTHNLDPEQIEQFITPRTTAIIGVHVWGTPCVPDVLETIAEKHGLKLMFDAAHAFGCSHQGKMLGGFGDAEVFSFHATKFMNSFEGGAVTTNDDELAERIRFMKNFGFAGYDQVDYVGTNGKMTEVAAAMGLTSLESLDHFIATNYKNYVAYREGLANIPGIRMFEYDEAEKRNYQYIVLEVDADGAGISRNRLVELLHAENILARRYFYPGVHRMEPYSSLFPHAGLLLPNTQTLSEQTMILPTGTAVNPDDVARVCEVIRFIVANAAEVNA